MYRQDHLGLCCYLPLHSMTSGIISAVSPFSFITALTIC